MLESAMESGFNSAGVDVVLLGPIPTPAVAYLTRAQRASLGVVISASHNSFEDNGIKFFSALGAKLPDSWEIDVEAALKEAPQWASSAYLGKSKRLDDAPGRYIEFCKSTFDKSLSLKGLKIVVDGAHGAAYHIAPKVFHELGADVIAIGCAPDGLNINKDVGATHPQALIDAVLSHKADVGIALDGDADRLQVVDAAGRMFNGDELLYMLARDRLQRGYSVPGVVGTLMTNMAVELAFRRLGVEMVRAKIGDRYVLEQLEQRGWLLGGESSGHLLALDIHTTGDGLISALQVLQAAVRTNDTLAGMLDDVHLFPQTLLNVKLKLGQQGWQSNIALQEGVAAVELELGDTGRVVIRASGTEPLLRVMVEAADAQQAQALAQRLADLV
jgi:phosphoglucosamine mutase